jgi:hypothetical protein
VTADVAVEYMVSRSVIEDFGTPGIINAPLMRMDKPRRACHHIHAEPSAPTEVTKGVST